jgi:hypothetical protein
MDSHGIVLRAKRKKSVFVFVCMALLRMTHTSKTKARGDKRGDGPVLSATCLQIPSSASFERGQEGVGGLEEGGQDQDQEEKDQEEQDQEEQGQDQGEQDQEEQGQEEQDQEGQGLCMPEDESRSGSSTPRCPLLLDLQSRPPKTLVPRQHARRMRDFRGQSPKIGMMAAGMNDLNYACAIAPTHLFSFDIIRGVKHRANLRADDAAADILVLGSEVKRKCKQMRRHRLRCADYAREVYRLRCTDYAREVYTKGGGHALF